MKQDRDLNHRDKKTRQKSTSMNGFIDETHSMLYAKSKKQKPLY